MIRAELTFDVVDDLIGAYSRDRLGVPKQAFAPARLGPLLELALQSNGQRVGPLLQSAWLDRTTQIEFRRALAGPNNEWFGPDKQVGFLRTVYDPSNEAHDVARTGFLLAARQAAERVGFSVGVSQGLAAAIREMESNIHEHSQLAETGILGFQTDGTAFEFVIADCGVGVLATLQESPDMSDLRDHGRALYLALQEGTSRYGQKANRGMGFRDLFLGLASLNGDLRFRSGDHALTISGPHPDMKVAHLAQKPFYQGFLASVRCEPLRAARMLH